MIKRVGFMFAGQGAQCVGMGRDLYDQSPAARALFDQADALLGRSISSMCFDGPADALTASANCQPAIYVMSMACVAAFRERFAVGPAVCAGLSLGEFGALTSAGVLGFADGVMLVDRRGSMMDDACAASDGTMAAVIGADAGLVERICGEHDVDVANYNCPGQIVISGERACLEAAVSALGAAGVSRVMPLNVAGAYHSRLMSSAASRFGTVLAEVALTAPAVPVVQNVTGCATESPEDIRDNLRAQVTGSVRWETCVGSMIGQGIDLLIEFGPGRVLSGFMRRIDRRFPVGNVGSMADLDGVGEWFAN